jgi:hypothetical protein
MKRVQLFVSIFAILFMPACAIAAPGDNVNSLWSYIMTIIQRLTQLFWVLSVMVFLWGLIEYLKKQDSPAEQAKAKQLMIHAVIAFTIAVSFWALVTYVIRSAQLDAGQPTIPKVYSR